MTRCVVYDYETVEPITVIHLKAHWVEFLLRRGSMQLPIIRPIEVCDIAEGADRSAATQ